MSVVDQVSRWRALRHASRDQLLVRATIAAAPLAAVGTMALDGTSSAPLALVVAALSLGCALAPDSHLGLLVVLVVAIWHAATVDASARATTLVVTACLVVLHLAMAAGTVAPVAARWSPAMRRRWLGRTAVVIGTGGVAWAAAGVIDGRSPAGTTPVLAAALVVTAVGAVWLRAGALGRTRR